MLEIQNKNKKNTQWKLPYLSTLSAFFTMWSLFTWLCFIPASLEMKQWEWEVADEVCDLCLTCCRAGRFVMTKQRTEEWGQMCFRLRQPNDAPRLGNFRQVTSTHSFTTVWKLRVLQPLVDHYDSLESDLLTCPTPTAAIKGHVNFTLL